MPASASSAAILGVDRLASADQPPVSRMLTKRIVCVLPPSSATSPNSRASCVHATTTSPAAWSANAASSFWQSIVFTGSVAASSSARASAAPSSGIVPLHEQRCSFLSARLIVAEARCRAGSGRMSSCFADRTGGSIGGDAGSAAAWRRRAAGSVDATGGAAPSSGGTSSTKPWALTRVFGGAKNDCMCRSCRATSAAIGSGRE